MARRATLILCAAALLASLLGVARAGDPCADAPDGTPCPDNGDGCFYNDGLDKCLAGACASPPPCARTTFTALSRGNVRMDWSKDPSAVTDGEYCEGRVLVTADEVHQLIGVRPPSDGGLVTITRTRKSRKLVPRGTGRVRLRLRLNHLGRLLLMQQATPTVTISVRARMTLTTPVNGKVVGANRTIVLRRRR